MPPGSSSKGKEPQTEEQASDEAYQDEYMDYGGGMGYEDSTNLAPFSVDNNPFLYSGGATHCDFPDTSSYSLATTANPGPWDPSDSTLIGSGEQYNP
jgi:hypothetical protein